MFRAAYGADSPWKVMSSRLGFAMRRMEKKSVNPSVNGYIRKDKASKGEEGLRLSFAVPKINRVYYRSLRNPNPRVNG